MIKLMTAEQILENYILERPNYWEFENEINEVARLKSLCKEEVIN
jgi:hypothetical protein